MINGLLFCGWINKEMTFIFCYTLLTLWKLNYGVRKEAKQYMRPAQLDSQEGGELENEQTG